MKPIQAVDIFVVHEGFPKKVTEGQWPLKLTQVCNRGTQIFPGVPPRGHLTDVHQCRFASSSGGAITLAEVRKVLEALESSGHFWCETHLVF